MSKAATLTDERIVSAIRDTLFDLLGESAARALEFFVDPRLAIKEPDRYERAMKEMFHGHAKIIIERIERNLCALVGIQLRSWSSFHECLKVVKNGS